MRVQNKDLHLSVIDHFLVSLNLQTNRYILKGGTALLYHGLDRFSEDIDLDGSNSNQLKSFISRYAKSMGYSYNVKKDTPTVYKVMLNYGIGLLKIELSLRGVDYQRVTTSVSGIRLYTKSKILELKLFTLNGRYKLRDLYDVAYLWESSRGIFTNDDIIKLTSLLAKRFPFSSLDRYLLEQQDSILPKEAIELLISRLLLMYGDLNLL